MDQPRILIIEDNPDLAKAMVSLLRISGFNAAFALSEATSFQAMRSSRPQLVLLDLNIANVNGLDLLQEMRQSEDLHDLPVIIYTALDDPALRVRARDLGAIDYVVKGVLDGEYLEELVRRHLARLAKADSIPSPGKPAAVKTLPS